MKPGFVIVRAEANPALVQVFLCLVSADLVVVAICCYIYNEQLYRYGSRGLIGNVATSSISAVSAPLWLAITCVRLPLILLL